MYIDSVSGTLQSLNDTAGNLNRFKAQYEEDQLKRAELLNRMGQNPAAEKALWDANHSGLLTRYLPNMSKGWEADSPFNIEGESLDSLNSLSADAIEGQKLSGLDDKGLKAQALSSLAGDFADTRGMTEWGNVSDNTVATDKLRSLDGKMINDDFVANKVFSSGGDKVAPKMVGDPVLKPLKFKTRGIADSNPYTREYREKIAAYQKEKSANDVIETRNKSKEKRNGEIPSFAKTYKGDETDQLTQLNNDATKAIKYYLNKGDTTSAMLAYDTYITTGNSIAQRYQHDFKAIDAKSLFPKGKGGGNGRSDKKIDYSYGTGGIGGKGTLIQLPEYTLGDEKAQMKYIETHYPKLWAKEPYANLSAKVGTEGTEFQTPEDKARTEELQNKNSLTQSDAWEALVDKYDGVLTSRAKAREKAYAELRAQGKDVVMDQYGRYVIVDGGSSNRNVVQSNPEDEVTF
jgi:hypothetical protein